MPLPPVLTRWRMDVFSTHGKEVSRSVLFASRHPAPCGEPPGAPFGKDLLRPMSAGATQSGGPGAPDACIASLREITPYASYGCLLERVAFERPLAPRVSGVDMAYSSFVESGGLPEKETIVP